MLAAETLWDLVELRARATPDAPMLWDERDRRLCYAQYEAAAEAAAAGLCRLGVGPGTTVAYQLPTRLETVVLMGALARLGAIQVPLVPIYRETEVAACLRETGAEFLCIPEPSRGVDYAALAAAATEGLDVRIVSCAPELPDGAPSILPPPPHDGRTVRWIYYTSGTTGVAKGARHTDQGVALASAGLLRRQHCESRDRFGLAFPFTHIGGLTNLVGLFQQGHSLVIAETFDPAATARQFARAGVTIVGGGPVFVSAFLEEQRKQPGARILPDLRIFSSGGAPLAPELYYAARRELGGRGVLQGYGMTECPMICMNDAADGDEKRAETEGRPIDGVRVKVVTASGEPAPAGGEGEIRIQSWALCRGYVDREANAAAFDADGWFRTGDVGYVDRDGYVTLTGRAKDIIIRKGENVAAREIEGLLHAHPKVGEAAVVGLPDPRRGELVCAVVTPAAGGSPLSFAEMVEHFRKARVMPQKTPERLEVVDALPRNPTGKVLKRELRQRFTPSRQ